MSTNASAYILKNAPGVLSSLRAACMEASMAGKDGLAYDIQKAIDATEASLRVARGA